ncbi:MAG: hypothetical protein FWB73_00020 [Treponema sp.]|nr:hypothetical protein [Treponema sp.]
MSRNSGGLLRGEGMALSFEEAIKKGKEADHKAILVAVRSLTQLGYLVESIACINGKLSICCYCPQVNESSTGN